MMDAVILIFIGILIASLFVVLRRRYAEFYGQSIEDYSESFPTFDIQQQLNGKMVCDGVIFGPLGRVTSTFIAEFDISWDGAHGVMDEMFRYNDGSTQKRQWIITMGENGSFSTEAEDVPGGGRGRQAGMAVQMRYAIRLPENSGGYLLDTVDWMYLTPDGVIVNRSQFRKFGFRVAELVATIRPKEAA